VEGHDVARDLLVALLVAHVADDEDEVEAGEDRALEVDVLLRRSTKNQKGVKFDAVAGSNCELPSPRALLRGLMSGAGSGGLEGVSGGKARTTALFMSSYRPKVGLAAARTDVRVLSTVVMPALAMEMVCGTREQ
jgi:hypothetical protein